MRSLLSIADLTPDELKAIVGSAAEAKKGVKSGSLPHALDGKVIGLLFEKPSTRTRNSFESAVFRLGGSPVYMRGDELQLSRGEPLEDTARILGGYFDALVARVYSHDTVVRLGRWSGVPVVNALSDLEHPTQVVSDLLAMQEAKGRLSGLKIAYIGDGNNVCNSLMLGCAMEGMDFVAACPGGYDPDGKTLLKARKAAKESGGSVEIARKPGAAAKGADFLYTDVWVSMGDEAEKDRRLKDFKGYQINSGLVRLANKGAKVMHCLPAHRGLEISADVIEGQQSIVWEQAEDKLYGAAAVLQWALAQR